MQESARLLASQKPGAVLSFTAALDLARAPQEKVWVQVRLGEGAGAVEQEQVQLF